MPTKVEKDEITGQSTTGHVWDGLRELNTPLPKWWLYVFYATIAFAVVYTIAYPAWPWFTGHTSGMMGYWSRSDLGRQLDDAAKQRAPMIQRIRNASLADIRGNEELRAIATAGGRGVFAENCVPCHGSGGSGTRGYPSLVDDVWLWGGSLDDIYQTIAYGVRNAHDKSRQSIMPRFGIDGVLNPEQIRQVTEYVVSLNGRTADPKLAAAGGKIFAEQCASCHGANGAGNREFGGPPLNGQVWLYGSSREEIAQQIANPRLGAMPAWSTRLDDATIKMLTVYVHALGGGK